MGVDGFLMGNFGLTTDLSSVQIASQAEHLAKKESEIKIKDVEESEKDNGVKSKSDEERENQEFNDGLSEKNEDSEENDEDLQQNKLNEKEFIKNNPKEFSIKINSKTDMIELLNNKSGKVVESINAENLMQVFSKLDNASGILVNRKI